MQVVIDGELLNILFLKGRVAAMAHITV